jgi:hypothetical protein
MRRWADTDHLWGREAGERATSLSIADFCSWYDVRSVLKDLVDRLVSSESRSSRSVQTSLSQRHVKIHTTTRTLSPDGDGEKRSTLYLNIDTSKDKQIESIDF